MKRQRLSTGVFFLWAVLLTTANVASGKQEEPLIADELDILGLSTELTDVLDARIKPFRSKKKRLRALHELLYSPEGFNIGYEGHHTKTAMQTFHDRRGNCVSLSNLFIAAARHVGLNAKYQSVRVDRTWFPRDGFYEVPGHMNVRVNMGNARATIEFNEAFFDNITTKKFDTKILSDRDANAEFYNNLGVDKLVEQKLQEAVGYFLRGIALSERKDFIWSNLGVAYKQMGDYKNAEISYQEALRLNKNNRSAISNIYILYSFLNNNFESKIYAEKAEKYARKNPYYLAKTADEYIRSRNYKHAVKHLKSAIRIHREEPQFYHALSVAYYYMNKISLSRKALKKAIKYSIRNSDKYRYEQKMQSLAKLQ